MMRKIGRQAGFQITLGAFSSNLRYSLIINQSISNVYYTALYCPGKPNVLLLHENSHFRIKQRPSHVIKSLDYT